MDSVVTMFLKSFNKNDHFQAGMTICILLKDQVLSQCERILGFCILCDLYRNESHESNPFLPMFLDTVLDEKVKLGERKFLMHLLSSAPSNCEVFYQNIYRKVDLKIYMVEEIGERN